MGEGGDDSREVLTEVGGPAAGEDAAAAAGQSPVTTPTSSVRMRLQELHQHHHSWFETSSTSMERLGGRIKKKMRHVMNAMDSGAIPATHRAPRNSISGSSSRLQRDDEEMVEGGQEESKLLVDDDSPSSPGSSGELREEEEEEDEGGVNGGSNCSSPEQDTVSRRPNADR